MADDGCFRALQYQEAQDLPLPFAQRHRPQVPPEPQICAARNHEGSGRQSFLSMAHGPTDEVNTTISCDDADSHCRRRRRRASARRCKVTTQTSTRPTGRAIESERNYTSTTINPTDGSPTPRKTYFWAAATGVRDSYRHERLGTEAELGVSDGSGRTMTTVDGIEQSIGQWKHDKKPQSCLSSTTASPSDA